MRILKTEKIEFRFKTTEKVTLFLSDILFKVETSNFVFDYHVYRNPKMIISDLTVATRLPLYANFIFLFFFFYQAYFYRSSRGVHSKVTIRDLDPETIYRVLKQRPQSTIRLSRPRLIALITAPPARSPGSFESTSRRS